MIYIFHYYLILHFELYRSCTKSTIRYIHSTTAATVLPVYRHRRLCWWFARSDTANVPRHHNVRKCWLSNSIYTPLHTSGSTTDSLVINITRPHPVISHNVKQWRRRGGAEVGYKLHSWHVALHGDEWSESRSSRFAPEKERNRRQGAPQRGSGCPVEERNLLSVAGLELRISQPTEHCVTNFSRCYNNTSL